MPDDQKLRIIRENARQIVEVVQTTFPEFSSVTASGLEACRRGSKSDIAELACQWLESLSLVGQYEKTKTKSDFEPVKTSLLSFAERAQEIMSGTASNYNLDRLYLGAGLAALAVILACVSSFSPLCKSGISGLYLGGVIVSYGIMMFASSYVEEEQQFWYWALSGWAFWLHVKEYVLEPMVPPSSETNFRIGHSLLLKQAL